MSILQLKTAKTLAGCISSKHITNLGVNGKTFHHRLNSSTSQFQYLQRSIIPTDHFQKSLPRLPVPDLSKSCQRYLESLKPIISSAEQYGTTKQIVKSFETGIGTQLQNELISINKHNKQTSYITGPWFDMYLKSRSCLPLNYNPFMAWKDDPNVHFNVPTVRATNMIISALRFRRSLVENILEPEVFHLNPKKSDTKFYRRIMKLMPSPIAFYGSAVFKAFPLDMSQYSNLFSSTRIPCEGKDILVKYENSKHICVLKNGQFYCFDVLDVNGDIKDPKEIHACLHDIEQMKPDNSDSITVFSTEDRGIWAKNRNSLASLNSTNAESLTKVDSALFHISLDDVDFGDDRIAQAHNFLHGNLANKPINRWFDKSFSLLYTSKGHVSINFEHSWGDGVAVLRFFNEVYQDSTKNHFITEKETNSTTEPDKHVRHLKFQLDNNLKAAAVEARNKYNKLTGSLSLLACEYDKMNREYFKKKKLSPDSMFQLAFQLAFRRLYGDTPATYEACSTAAFKHGRTETIRSATSQTKAACDAFLDTRKPAAVEIKRLLDACSKKHFELSKNAATGQGFDRHLFVLKILAESKGNLPDIFTDKSYTEANQFVLSTSTLYGEYFEGGGFAPVVPNGFGLGYGFINNSLGVFISNYTTHRNGSDFSQALRLSLDDIFKVLELT